MAHSLKVVFRSDVRGIARAGDVKAVSPGYAQNYLFPRKLAFPATTSALKQWDTERQGALVKAERLRADSQALAEKIAAKTITVTVKASTEGRLFGSVSRQDVLDSLAKDGITLDKQAVILPQPIKQVGITMVRLHLDAGVESALKVEVIAEAPKETTLPEDDQLR